MTKQEIKKAEEFLDERFDIWVTHDNYSDLVYYRGAIAMLEILGYDWVRHNGEHTLIKKC